MYSVWLSVTHASRCLIVVDETNAYDISKFYTLPERLVMAVVVKWPGEHSQGFTTSSHVVKQRYPDELIRY
jgi:hypothetical protein